MTVAADAAREHANAWVDTAGYHAGDWDSKDPRHGLRMLESVAFAAAGETPLRAAQARTIDRKIARRPCRAR